MYFCASVLSASAENCVCSCAPKWVHLRPGLFHVWIPSSSQIRTHKMVSGFFFRCVCQIQWFYLTVINISFLWVCLSTSWLFRSTCSILCDDYYIYFIKFKLCRYSRAGWLVLFSEWEKVAEEEEEHVGRLISSVAMIPKMLPASAALENEII